MAIKIEYLDEMDDVYDINVETNHNFFANNILVHNCVESYSNVQADKYSHVCNLLSLVVGRIDSDEEMIELSSLSARILDNGIELTTTPTKESELHNKTFRTIGIGIQGLHDYMAKFNISWDNYDEITKVAELIEYGAVKESIKMANERGKYPLYDGSKWDTGELLENFKRNSVTSLDWNQLQENLKLYGIRNSQLTSPAPNTSSSVFMDASPGIMPVYSAFYLEDNKTGKFPVFGMYIKENPLSYERTAPRQDQVKMTRVVGSLQKFIDTGISAEYVLDLNRDDFSAKTLYDLIIGAWKNKTKAVYYIRSIKKGETIDAIIGGESVCVGCTG